MDTRSEFQRILDEALGQTSRENSEVHGEPPKSSGSFSEDLFRTIEFSFGPIQNKFFRNINKIYPQGERRTTEPPNPKIEEPKIKIEPFKKPEPQPRVRRKFSADQNKGILIFFNFGVKIDEYSSDDEIKVAYRKLAKKFHPDLNKNNGDDFKVISKAYSAFF
jgi:DnaJ domain